MEPAARTKNMTPAALPHSEAFHLRLEVQANRTRDKEAQSASAYGSVRHLSLSYLREKSYWNEVPTASLGIELGPMKTMIEKRVVGGIKPLNETWRQSWRVVYFSPSFSFPLSPLLSITTPPCQCIVYTHEFMDKQWLIFIIDTFS
ncbi:hypothetical protein EVAR_87849_1 [Eumeta japonica]|uniref:Uncharacterized protein n=1 Tax=Eumeta variegata TaxID=151549 RepID=A0A4C1YG68_EUMVA|nr:hypothetical protein EVAR_87849_1 [Eumeta japonica]